IQSLIRAASDIDLADVLLQAPSLTPLLLQSLSPSSHRFRHCLGRDFTLAMTLVKGLEESRLHIYHRTQLPLRPDVLHLIDSSEYSLHRENVRGTALGCQPSEIGNLGVDEVFPDQISLTVILHHCTVSVRIAGSILDDCHPVAPHRHVLSGHEICVDRMHSRANTDESSQHSVAFLHVQTQLRKPFDPVVGNAGA
ncbi:hypothetical protein PENTCL1PPCAC_25520, partial [Pristionchus entomophagus]